jgi:hypothetical protein
MKALMNAGYAPGQIQGFKNAGLQKQRGAMDLQSAAARGMGSGYNPTAQMRDDYAKGRTKLPTQEELAAYYRK